MHDRLFEVALGLTPPWSVTAVSFDESSKVLTINVDFAAGSRFAVEGVEGEHPVHDTLHSWQQRQLKHLWRWRCCWPRRCPSPPPRA